ncbi:MAG: hypothetical protein WAK48_26940 [Candidatus Acidiferrum sp.]
MPEEEVLERARHDKEEGKSPSTQAGEFVREQMHHLREGKHGARSPQQAIAIGLSKARRAGVAFPSPKRGTSAQTRKQARRDTQKKVAANRKPSRVRSRATLNALKREGHSAASPANLSKQARTVAQRRGSQSRHQSAEKAIRTKGKAGMHRAARKAASTRGRKSAYRNSPGKIPQNDRGSRQLV